MTVVFKKEDVEFDLDSETSNLPSAGPEYTQKQLKTEDSNNNDCPAELFTRSARRNSKSSLGASVDLLADQKEYDNEWKDF